MEKRAQELTSLIELYLEDQLRNWSETILPVEAGSPALDAPSVTEKWPVRDGGSVPGALAQPVTSNAALHPHLSNAIRRMNEVLREQSYSFLCQKDQVWPLGGQIQRGRQRSLDVGSVAFLGKSGSHSHTSALCQYPDAVMYPVASFAEACRMVLDGMVDAAVLPIDNSTAGTIGDVYDLLHQRELFIVRGASLSIRNVLLGVRGSSLSTLREVWTHPQPIAQCAGFLKRNGLRAVPMESTAVAAEAVARKADPTVAAIGSREAADLYGLDVLTERIDDMSSNQTRFVTVARELVIPADASRLSLLFTLPHASGSLSSVLSTLADYGLNVTKIQSRPIPQHPWEYSFHLDFDSGVENGNVQQALYLLDHDLPYLKLLGWYPEQAGVSELSDDMQA